MGGQFNPEGNPTAVRNAIVRYVINQYGRRGVSLLAQPAAGDDAQAPVPAAAEADHPFHSRGGPPHTAHKAEHGNEGPTVINDWTCRIHCKKYELGGSYW